VTRPTFLLEAIGAGDGADAQGAPLQHQPLAHLDPFLEILGQIAPAPPP